VLLTTIGILTPGSVLALNLRREKKDKTNRHLFSFVAEFNDPKNVLHKDQGFLQLATETTHKRESSRRFLNYTFSVWGMMWLQRISQWQEEQSICEHILSPDQAEFLPKFQVTLCTHHLEASPWCAMDDPFTATRYLYNKES
jgi:hypothetical protein